MKRLKRVIKNFIAHRQNIINQYGSRGQAVKRLTKSQVLAGSPPLP